MVKAGSQRQKEYLKKIEGEKIRRIFRERKEKNEGKADTVEKPQTSTITMRKYKKTQTKKLQRVTGRKQVWMLFFEYANAKRTFCGFQQSVLG